MKTSTCSLPEKRREILAQIGQIPVVVEGTLTQRQRKRGRGRVAVYHQLQRWRAGHNDTRHIPADRVQLVREGIAGYEQAQALLQQIARLDEAAVLAPVPADGKKKPTQP
jgi:hypothetical protein